MWREGGGVRLCASGGVGCIGLGPDWRHMQAIFAGLLWMDQIITALRFKACRMQLPPGPDCMSAIELVTYWLVVAAAA